MEKTKAKSLTLKIATAGILYAIIIVMQLVKNISPFISGPVINACMMIAMIEVGLWCGIAYGIVVPITSLLFAFASPTTALATTTYGLSILIIIIGNLLFLLLGKLGSKQKLWVFILLLVVGALIKWLFMWGSSELIIKPVFADSLGDLMAVVNKIFSTLQLWAGLISVPIIVAIKKVLDLRRKSKTEKVDAEQTDQQE